MDPTEFMKYAIVIAGLYAGFWYSVEVKQTMRRSFGTRFDWIKFGLAVMSFYWMLFYLRSSIGITIGSTHQIWVRAPLLITIFFMGADASASGIRHWRKHK